MTEKYQIHEYNSHYNSYGDGKGIALYFLEDFEHVLDICTMNHQISKIKSIQFDIICVYRSSDSRKINQINFLKDLNSLIHVNRKTFVLGDFNFNALSPEKNLILKELGNWDFIQMVKKPTHFQGGLIDHCYKSDNIPTQ